MPLLSDLSRNFGLDIRHAVQVQTETWNAAHRCVWEAEYQQEI